MTNRRVTVGLASVAFLLTWATVELSIRRGTARWVEITCPRGQILRVELADDATLRSKGLSGRSALESDGMLFQWSTAGTHSIWMRDMRFPIDIVWCDDVGAIVAIKERVPPCERDGDCPLYGARVSNSRFVLELRASSISALGLRVGERLHISRSAASRIANLDDSVARQMALSLSLDSPLGYATEFQAD